MEFREFVDKKEREARRHLKLIQQVLGKGGFEVADNLEARGEPHIYIVNPSSDLPFEGVRMYEIGGEIAYRIQKRPDTQPFGKAYSVPVEKMFEDLLGEDDMDDKKKGTEIMEAIIKELKDFFEQSAKAERDMPTNDPLGAVAMRSTGTDYANKVHDLKGR